MLKLVIEDDEGRQTVVPFSRDELTIGREEGNTVRLAERDVSRRHVRLRRQDGQVVVEDLGSAYGTRLNGEPIKGHAPFREGDRLEIGSFSLVLAPGGVQPSTPPPSGVFVAVEAPAALPAPAGAPAPAVPVLLPAAVPSAAAAPAPAPLPAGKEGAQLPERLRVLNAGLSGREFPCTAAELRIGRAEDNDVVLEHRSLSRHHARLLRGPDGQWTLEDLQSANGVFINGERCERSALRSGDLVELGQVRLRFLGAGQRAVMPLRPRTLGLLLLVAVVLAAAGVRIARSGPRASPLPPAAAPQAAARETPAVQPAPAVPTPASAPAGAAAAPPESGPALTGPSLARLQAAEEAAARRAFVEAVAQLEALTQAGPVPADVEARLADARAEATVQQALAQLPGHLAAGRLDEAARLLDASASTRAFTRELAAAKEQLAAALAEQERKRPTSAARTRQERSLRRAEVLQLYEQGREALKQGQVEQAEAAFKRCLLVDAQAAVCHLGLGGTYARMPGQAESGATHYRRFLELAPQDPAVPEVKQLLAEYEKARRALHE